MWGWHRTPEHGALQLLGVERALRAAAALGACGDVAPGLDPPGPLGVERDGERFRRTVDVEGVVGAPWGDRVLRRQAEPFHHPAEAHALRVEDPGARARLDEDGGLGCDRRHVTRMHRGRGGMRGGRLALCDDPRRGAPPLRCREEAATFPPGRSPRAFPARALPARAFPARVLPARARVAPERREGWSARESRIVLPPEVHVRPSALLRRSPPTGTRRGVGSARRQAPR